MLTRDFSEADEEKVSCEVAQGSSVAATAAVIQYLYTAQISINGDTVMEILAAADKLQLQHLRESCTSFLERSLNPANVCSILKACQQLDLADLEAKCPLCI